MIVPSNMDQDSHGDHDSGYHDGNWSHMHSYNPSPMSAFESEYYSQSGGQPLSMESFNMQMAPPPPPALRPQPQNVYSTQLPHGLLIPSHQTSQVPWPSLQTNPSRSFGTPPIPIPPASAPPRIAQTKLPSTATTGPRKTLTIEDRRAMCKYAEENPHVKQTEIGARFGVERSTVSKTLRNKDKFLSKTEETSSSPTQRTKGKGPPDIERTLASWVKSAQKTGAPINDADLEERARFFCAGAHCDGSKLITRAWIEKFKQKHGIGPRRRASETALSDTRYKNQPTLLAASSMTASGTTSPISPKTKASSVVPISNADLRSSLSISMDFESSNGKQPLPQSATTLPSATSEPASASFSSSAISPTSAYTFSPNLTGGLFDGLGPGQHRHRSQTLPNIDPLEYIDQSQAMDTLTPRLNNCVTGPSSAMTSPAHELATNPFAFESAISTPILRHVSSNSSLTGRSTASAAVSGTPISGPNSPTQDDARRAADVLLSYIQSLAAPGLVDQQDYEVVVRLTDKLRLHQHSQMMQQQSLPNKMNMTGQGLGILSRIPEGDAEIMHSPLTHLEN